MQGEAKTLQPGREKAWGNLMYMHKYLMGCNEEQGARLSSVALTGNGHKVKHTIFHCNTRKRFGFFFHCERCHTQAEVVESLSVEILKVHLEMALDSLL